MSEPTSVAVLGTGIMGAPMARNLCSAGLDVRVWNRTRAKAEPLAEAGARVAASPGEAVEGADVVLTMLHDGPATAETVRAAAPGLRSGAVWLQCTTAGLEGLAQLAPLARELGLTFVDAPVLGTRAPAEAGQLLVLAAGPAHARAEAAPVLEAIGSRTVWAGEEPGAATRLKLVCNSWVLAVTHGTVEAMALADGLGVDPQDFLDAVEGGSLDMGYLRIKAGAIRSRDFTPSRGHDWDDKVRVYGAAGVAVYLLLDMAEESATVFSEPSGKGYASHTTVPFGKTLTVPAPFGCELDTGGFGAPAEPGGEQAEAEAGGN